MYGHTNHTIRRLALVCVIVGLLGCDHDKSPTKSDPGPYAPQSSVDNVMRNFRESYVRRDSVEYGRLFAQDFTFAFNPQDVINPVNPTPVQWGLTDELAAARSMFGSALVERIMLNFDYDPAVRSDDEYAGTWKVLMRNVRLQVDTRTGDGSQLTLLLENAKETFYLKEYPSEKATDGRNLWRIWRWLDEPIGMEAGARTERGSWGGIKNLFR
jgi:hypothetical protein